MTGDGRDETPEQRADRNWIDLLQELRISQTGAQLLAGFLMTLPFQQRFGQLDGFQRTWYPGLVVLAALCVGLTLAPVALHRSLFRGMVKEQVVTVGHVVILVAITFVSLLLAGIIFLLFDVVQGRTPALVAGTTALVVLLGLLVVMPRVSVHRA